MLYRLCHGGLQAKDGHCQVAGETISLVASVQEVECARTRRGPEPLVEVPLVEGALSAFDRDAAQCGAGSRRKEGGGLALLALLAQKAVAPHGQVFCRGVGERTEGFTEHFLCRKILHDSDKTV